MPGFKGIIKCEQSQSFKQEANQGRFAGASFAVFAFLLMPVGIRSGASAALCSAEPSGDTRTR
jgi:hypothetical protein